MVSEYNVHTCTVPDTVCNIIVTTLGVLDHRVFGNSSRAQMAVGRVHDALADAEQCCSLKPLWPKVRHTHVHARVCTDIKLSTTFWLFQITHIALLCANRVLLHSLFTCYEQRINILINEGILY